ncbi:uracil DNA glycosylase [Onygenales sp. PD_10]|nr:uracil DNA glycosylase [Onygenales sp. PD_10]
MSTSQENPEPAEKTGRRVTYHPSHLLAEVGKSINTILPDLKVSTPYSTTWQGCLKTVSDSLSGVEDRHITIDSPIPTLRKRALRDELLRTIQASQQDSLLTTKPIRLQYDASQVPLPTPLSRQAKERVKELAGPLLPCEEPYPVTTIQAAVGLGALPTIPAKLILEGVDDDSKQEKMENAVMLFDTGARQTILTDDMLSPEFRDYLHNDPVHDPYRISTLVRMGKLQPVNGTAKLPRGSPGNRFTFIDGTPRHSEPRLSWNNLSVLESPSQGRGPPSRHLMIPKQQPSCPSIERPSGSMHSPSIMKLTSCGT